jgi:hypothetical protein
VFNSRNVIILSSQPLTDERRRRIRRCHRERAEDRRACPRSTQRTHDPALFPLAFGSYALRSFSLPGSISLNDHTPQITDQPRVRPSVVSGNREKHVILSLAVPSTSHVDISTPLVSAIFRLIDALEKINLRPETKSKIKKTRENFAKSLKDETEREAREEAADAKLAAKRRAEEERIARLSAAEQLKVILLSFYILALVLSPDAI